MGAKRLTGRWAMASIWAVVRPAMGLTGLAGLAALAAAEARLPARCAATPALTRLVL